MTCIYLPSCPFRFHFRSVTTIFRALLTCSLLCINLWMSHFSFSLTCEVCGAHTLIAWGSALPFMLLPTQQSLKSLSALWISAVTVLPTYDTVLQELCVTLCGSQVSVNEKQNADQMLKNTRLCQMNCAIDPMCLQTESYILRRYARTDSSAVD